MKARLIPDGYLLLYDGSSDLWITSRVGKTRKRVKKDMEATASAVDVKFRDSDDQI